MRFAIPLLALHNLGTLSEENTEVLPFLAIDSKGVPERKLEKEVRHSLLLVSEHMKRK